MIKRYRITGHELFQNRLCGSADWQGQPHAGTVYTIRYYCWTDQQVQHFYATRKNCVHTQKMQIT